MSDQESFQVGERGTDVPDITQFEQSPFKKGRPPEPLHFEVNVVAEAHDRQKKSGVVQVNIPGFSPAKLYCDEQKPVGDDTAPPPLAFFSAGIAFCLLTHLTDILTARKIEITSMKIEQRMRFMTNLSTMRDLGHTTEGACEGIESHVIIDSPEPPERVQALLAEAEGACMAHHALRNPLPWMTRLVHNGTELDTREGVGPEARLEP
ncbi:OsmC-related (seleno)protein [Maricaulis sp. D1M11]|uniref:OsmC-related (seleno)protein n=1 Tax=Maricaulis sp. D1M11 TaxID=3076117 RepID=UPI0039B5307E